METDEDIGRGYNKVPSIPPVIAFTAVPSPKVKDVIEKNKSKFATKYNLLVPPPSLLPSIFVACFSPQLVKSLDAERQQGCRTEGKGKMVGRRWRGRG